jgi:hypothetical protein
MTEAIFGLVGVVIGGLLNGGVTWLIERGRLQGDVKVAARLVASELEMNQVAAASAITSESRGNLTFGSVDEWKQRRETLASALSDEEWSGIDNYFLFYEHMMTSMAAGEMTDEAKQSLRVLVTKGKWAIKAIRRYAGEEVVIIEKLETFEVE